MFMELVLNKLLVAGNKIFILYFFLYRAHTFMARKRIETKLCFVTFISFSISRGK